MNARHPVSLETALARACDEIGVRFPGVPSRPGEWHRADVGEHANGKSDASIKVFAGGAGGIVKNWQTDEIRVVFADDGRALSPDERAERKHRLDEARREAEAERERRAKDAAATAFAIWNKATPARDDHPYLARKLVRAVETLHEIDVKGLKSVAGYAPKSDGEPLQGRVLVAPVYTGAKLDKLSTIELIDETGRKSALAGGVKSGGAWAVAPVPAEAASIVIAEGVATACSIHEATGWPTVAALSAGNLAAVAKAVHAKHRGASIIVAGDLGNGQEAAGNAARAVGGIAVFPDFGADSADGQTDFNDLRQARGTEAVRAQIEAAIASADDEYPDIKHRPCWRIYPEWKDAEGVKLKPGVYLHTVKHGKHDEAPELIDKHIATPIWVRAKTRNREDSDYGRLLEMQSDAGLKKWAMPMEMLAGDGNEIRAVLLREGVTFENRNRSSVLDYIVGQQPKRTMRSASVTGWHEGAFVLPSQVIGADDIWFQSTGREAPYATAGTFEGWRELAALANENPLMMFAMASAFVGPLLHYLNIDGGGAHLYGDSSCGKTSAGRAAVSVWGSPRFERKWKATSNGLEGAAVLHSDTMLMLDEINEIKPQDLYDTAYGLVNGVGKTRANRYGEARQAARWRVFLLSTGELTVAARMAMGGIEAMAGQLVRILDVPVVGTHGIFENLHGRKSGGLLADEVRDLAAKHYGHAGPLFVEKLIGEIRDGLRLTEALAAIVKDYFTAESDQERRAARIFALCALAGELAARWNIAPWRAGEPSEAAQHAFMLWRSQRQDDGRGSEHAAILRAVSDFIDRHGDSRFSNIAVERADPVRERAGYYQLDGDRRLYLFTSGALREATRGYDFSRVLRALDEAKAIVKQAPNRKDQQARTLDGRRPWFYHIDAEKLDG
ncbi:TOPRIM and DUF927 domain-containing protein [Paraburkholderia silvatlantica]|uniref:DNA primase/helicase n=1 Tax=Paraburkholderia silvatlantica TaxID=321895 RepID=A0ABR6FRT7_9BURK|nr:DUF927 domain-containing protein [Paraburkholderia silvatlantica]MBB2930141.1 putative DNA primase/helicase [Paraburkholderia silvatlantica]PVY22482.1 putative DNA primase/helicase [Paraburkholderia silvatlantica]PXW28951.1 putative DNA primase/helicase [Paraburkholderia silvatlantica]